MSVTLDTVEVALSYRCNLCCPFCYVSDRRTDLPDQSVLLRQLRWAREQARGGPLIIAVYGGEPFMEWDRLQYLQRQLGERERLLVVTNMTLLNEARIKWIVDNGVRIGCSIDGCPEAQDLQRMYKTGVGGTSVVVYDAARRLREASGGREARVVRMTFTPATLRLLAESVRYLAEDAGFSVVNAVAASGVNWRSELGELREQAAALTDWWIERFRAGKPVAVHYLHAILKRLWALKIPRGMCGAGSRMCAVDNDLRIWPCHRFLGSKMSSDFALGHVDAFRLDRVNRWREYCNGAERNHACARCPAVIGCGDVCIYEQALAGLPLDRPVPNACIVRQVFYNQAIRAHVTLMAEQNAFYLRAYGGAA